MVGGCGVGEVCAEARHAVRLFAIPESGRGESVGTASDITLFEIGILF